MKLPAYIYNSPGAWGVLRMGLRAQLQTTGKPDKFSIRTDSGISKHRAFLKFRP